MSIKLLYGNCHCFLVPQLRWSGQSYKDHHGDFLFKNFTQNLWDHAKWMNSIKSYVELIFLQGIFCQNQSIQFQEKISLDLLWDFPQLTNFPKQLRSQLLFQEVQIFHCLAIRCHIQFAGKVLCSETYLTSEQMIPCSYC